LGVKKIPSVIRLANPPSGEGVSG